MGIRTISVNKTLKNRQLSRPNCLSGSLITLSLQRVAPNAKGEQNASPSNNNLSAKYQRYRHQTGRTISILTKRENTKSSRGTSRNIGNYLYARTTDLSLRAAVLDI